MESRPKSGGGGVWQWGEGGVSCGVSLFLHILLSSSCRLDSSASTLLFVIYLRLPQRSEGKPVRSALALQAGASGMYSIGRAALRRGERLGKCAVTVNRRGCAAAYEGDERRVVDNSSTERCNPLLETGHTRKLNGTDPHWGTRPTGKVRVIGRCGTRHSLALRPPASFLSLTPEVKAARRASSSLPPPRCTVNALKCRLRLHNSSPAANRGRGSVEEGSRPLVDARPGAVNDISDKPGPAFEAVRRLLLVSVNRKAAEVKELHAETSRAKGC
ncbi:hypothetical protein EYF80_037505 [Liparis tanakae]|uniref:Uncharacterized protein n=1 Tax=Liparis tanakae TaxID=230148 RepID=A0A4Z2GFG9_9TELE|nr:hypothetical protein EYF80_037505 [Liparis tanakae]